MGNALRYQYEAGAAMDTDLPDPNLDFNTIKKAR
jgi:hypothetical protein